MVLEIPSSCIQQVVSNCCLLRHFALPFKTSVEIKISALMKPTF